MKDDENISLCVTVIMKFNHILNAIMRLSYSIFTLSSGVSRFRSTNNKSQLYHPDISVQVLIAFND